MTSKQQRHVAAAQSGRILSSAESQAPETYCTSGTSPTLHLIGPGQVGRCVLDRLAAAEGPDAPRLIAVSDSSGTVVASSLQPRAVALSPADIAAHKRAGGRVSGLDGADALRTSLAARVVEADIVVDTTASDPSRTAEAQAIGDAVLQRGGRLVLASKFALCASVEAWLAPEQRPRLGCNAVLGGTGAALLAELEGLRTHATEAAHCGSATTTVIIEAVENGGSVAEGIERAAALGLLEADPEIDLRGGDAAVKLALVAGILNGHAVEPGRITSADVRSLSPELLRERAACGKTTRLVGRWTRESAGSPSLHLGFEELARTSPLVADYDRLVYAYDIGGTQRVHVGTGVGPEGTAEAVWTDVAAFASEIVGQATANKSTGGAL